MSGRVQPLCTRNHSFRATRGSTPTTTIFVRRGGSAPTTTIFVRRGGSALATTTTTRFDQRTRHDAIVMLTQGRLQQQRTKLSISIVGSLAIWSQLILLMHENCLVVDRGDDPLSQEAQENATLNVRMHLRAILATRRILEKSHLTKEVFDWVISEVETKFNPLSIRVLARCAALLLGNPSENRLPS